MFIARLGCPERKGNHSLIFKMQINPKILKSTSCVTSSNSKPVPVAFLFPLLLADIDKKYRDEREFDKE